MIQPFLPRLEGYHRVQHQLEQHLLDRANHCFDEADRLRAELTSPDQVHQWQQQTRERVFEAIGGLPKLAPDPRIRVTGEYRTGRYTIERILFDSMPGVTVSANLYRPHGTSVMRRPAVLLLCGHSRAAKAYPSYQTVCSVLANNGFVVLAVDPFGQGERMQCVDRATGGQVVR